MTRGSPSAAGETRRILLIKTQAIGDLLMTTPAIRDLRKAFPRAHIALLVGKWSAPALRNSPHLDEILEFDDDVLLRPRFFGMLRLLARVRSRRFDTAVIFHPSPFLHAFAWLAGIPARYGLVRGTARRPNRFLTAAVTEDLGADTYYPVNFQRVAALAGAVSGAPDLEVHAEGDDETTASALLAEQGIAPGAPFILVAPGGGRNSKEDVAARRWPVERFVELLRSVRRDHPGLGIVLTGAAGDALETGRIAREIPEAVDLTARTSLTTLYAIVRLSRAVVGNDSSLLHIAVACRRPAVVPFGPTGAAQRLPAWALPYSVQSELPCSPCYRGGSFPGCGIGFQCLREMPAAALRARLDLALSADAATARPSYIA